MKKTVRTETWRAGAKYLFALLIAFVIGSNYTTNLVAQPATANYIIGVNVNNLTWNYPEADCALDVNVCAGIPLSSESPGEFGFIVGGNAYPLPPDAMPNTGSYVANYNLGVPLEDLIGLTLINVGDNIGPIMAAGYDFSFEAWENDCGELFQFETGIACTVNGDDSFATVLANIDFSAVVPVDANGQPIAGSYPVTIGPFAGGDGSFYGANLTVVVQASAPSLATCTLDALAPDGLGYNCLGTPDPFTGVEQATTSVTFGGGFGPYKIMGVGIYAVGGFDYPGNANGFLPQGAAFDFGADPFGISWDATVLGGAFPFLVNANQPWQVLIQDATGCIVAVEGNFDTPNTEFDGIDGGTMCEDDPILTLFADANTTNPLAPAFGTFASFPVAGAIVNGANGTATFDPFVAGPGRHTITYCITFNGGNCTTCTEKVVYVLPVFSIADVQVTNVLTSICESGDVQTLVSDGIANIAADFTAAGLQGLDPGNTINELNDYISWSGPGVTDLNDGTGSATFDPSVAGVGTHVINVTVGYTNCPTTYPFAIEVYPDFDPQLGEDLELCQVTGDVLNLIDLLFIFPNLPQLDPATDFGGVFTVNGNPIAGANVTVTTGPGGTQVFNVTYCGGDAAIGCEFCDQAVITVQVAPEASWNCNEDLGPIICEGAGTDGTFDVDPTLNDPFYVTGGPDLPTPNGCAVQPTPLIELYGAYDLDALSCVGPLIETQTLSATSASFAAPGTQSVSVTFAGIPDQAIIENMEISIAYQGTQPTSQGDINSLNVTAGPGGAISVMSWSDGACGPNVGPGNDPDAVGSSGIGGGNDHFGLNNIEDMDAFDGSDDNNDGDGTGLCGNSTIIHSFGLESGFIDPATGLPVPGYITPDGSTVLDWCDIVRAGGLISNECQGLPFTLTLNSNSANWNISISVTITYTIGEYQANTHEFFDAQSNPYTLPLPYDQNGDGLVDGDGELAGGVYYQGNGNWTFDATDLEEISEIEIEQIMYGCELVNGEYCNGIDNQAFWIVESFDPELVNAEVCEEDDDCQFDLTSMISGTFAPGFNLNGGEFYAEFGNAGVINGLVDFNQFVSGDIIDVCGVRDATLAQAAAIATATCNVAAAAAADETAAEAAYNAAAAASAANPGDVALATAAANAFTAWQAAIADANAAQADCDAATAIANGSYDAIPVSICYNVGTNPTCGGGQACATLTIHRQPSAMFSFPETVCTGSTYTLTPVETGGTWSGTLLGVVSVNGTQVTVTAGTATGLYTLTYTKTNGLCSDTYSLEVAVVNTPVAVSQDGTVCTGSITNLTQYVNGSSSLGGVFSGSSASGQVVGGVLLATGTPGTVSVTYTIGQAGTTCTASTTFTITVVSQANADFDLPSYVCTDQTFNLTTFLTPGTTTGGTFTATAGTVSGNQYTSPGTTQVVYITYTVGTGTCQVSDTEALQVFAPEDVQVESYGFVCQSAGNGTHINLSQYLPSGSGVLNGGTFTMGTVAPFISEVEYDASSNAMEYVEVMAAEGTDLSDYAVYFYARTSSADNTEYGNVDVDGGVNTGKASGRLYGIMQLNYTVGSVPNGNRQPDPLYHTDYRGVVVANGGTSYNWHPDGEPDGAPIDDVDVISDNVTVAASNGIAYGAVAFDPIIDVQAGPAGLALVNIRQAAWRLGYTNAEFDAMQAGSLDFLHFLTREIDWRNNDDVVQFVGYGIDGNTNLGIFSACNGPAATMVSIDLGVVDNGGNSRSLQFTNACWQVPNVTDPQLAYDDTPPYSTFQGSAAGQSGGTGGNAGVINFGLSALGGDDYYYNYIAPNGDVFKIERLCWQLFAVGQNVGQNTNHPNGCKFNGYTPFEIEEFEVDDQPGGLSNLDEEIVHFNCANPVYTIPFAYQVPPTSTSCGSTEGIFYLTVLMDIEDQWSAPEVPVCANSDDFSLTDLINDEVHYIQPYTRTGSFEASVDTTFEENMPAPYLSELHYQWYAQYGVSQIGTAQNAVASNASDDHCILYNFYSGLNTPNNSDDSYNQLWICEGIEISAPAGTDLSCYQLAFFKEEVLPNTVANGIGVNVTYVGPDGLLHQTNVAQNSFMQLYGIVDEDSTNPPAGTILYAPTFNNYVFGGNNSNASGVPYYAGNIPAPIGANPTQWFGLGNEPATGGLFEDVNNNGLYDAGDVALDATDFPWERANECNDGAGVGSRWFPIVNIPDNVGGVGLWNKCTGELLEFISWGGQLCVEDKEGFSLATGPFEQLTSTVIDTSQNTSSLGDQRTLQLVHCNQLPAEYQNLCGDDGLVWVLVYNGGAFTIPGTGVETGLLEDFAYSNSIGYYNCTADANWFNDRYTFSLDLTGNTELPNDAVITSHTVVVTIGTGNAGDFQVYTYTVNSGNCNASTVQSGTTGDWDIHDDTNWNSNICNIGDLSWAYTPGEICQNCANVLDNACIRGEFIDAFPYQLGNGGDNNVDYQGQPYGYNFDCNEAFTPSPTDELSAPGIQDLNDGLWETAFFDGNGEDALDNDCYVGECTGTAKTTYTVSNLSAYIYEGNVIQFQEDTCRNLIVEPSTFNVSIRVIINYRQCTPTGNFYTNLDQGGANQHAPSFGSNMTNGPVTLNTEDWDNPYWTLSPEWLYTNDIMDVEVNYNTTNYNQIEADDVTDDLACLDIANQTVRQQEVTILPGSNASFSVASVSACTGDVVDLAALASPAGGTFSTGSGSFNATTAGTFSVTYTVNAGTACADSDVLTIVVEQSGSVNTSGIPTSVCSLSSISLPAASWSGSGVSGNTFTPPGAGTYTLSYSAGSGACGVSGSVSINVLEPISVSESISQDDCASSNQYTVTLTISGGSGSYTVNGQAVAGNTYVGNYPSGDTYTLIVDDSGVCSSVVATGTSECPAQCAADAGTLSLLQSGLVCAPDGLTAFVSGNNTAAGYAGIFVLTNNATGLVAQTSLSGNFPFVSESGQYRVWYANLCLAGFPGGLPAITPGVTSVADITAIVAGSPAGAVDIAGPITVDVVNDIVIEVTPVCDNDLGGYVLQVRISGGAPQYNGAGSYGVVPQPTDPFDFFWDADATANGYVEGTIDNGGAPFSASQVVAVSVTSDGSLCSAAVTLTIPDVDCGLGAGNDFAATLVDEPINFNVLGNDYGLGIQVINVIQPANGSIIWDAAGNFTYIPNPGFIGTDAITYEIQNQFGYTSTATVVLTVGSVGAPLNVVWDRECINSNTEYTVFVNILGGTAPFTVSGDYNGTINSNTSFSFTKSDGDPFFVTVVDAAGDIKVIDENPEACSKVAVTIVSYTGTVQSNGNFLKWTTASEVDNDFFTLEHSTDGVSYKVIANVDGAGTTSLTNNYDFLHTNAPAGLSYYRLSTTDFNGNVENHGVVTLVRGQVGFGFVNVFPVPARETLNVNFSAVANASVRMDIYNVTGQLVATQAVDALSGMNNVSVDVKAYAVGTYFLTINNGTEVATIKFVVE